MADPVYLTDAERPYRPGPIQARYRFWLRYTIRRQLYCRWFETSDSRDTFKATLPPFTVFYDEGDETV